MQNIPFFSGLKIQSRLVLTFSALFVFCVLVLSLFLFNLLNLISLNDQSRGLFEENRRIYQVEALFKQYHLGLVNYSVSSSELSKMRLATLETRIDEALHALAQQSAIDSAAPLQALSAQKDSLYQLGRELLDAVDEQEALDPEEQDWYIPLELTQQINAQFVQIYGQTSQWSAQGKSQLDALTQRAAAQSGFTFGVALLAIPAFLGLAFLVALTIFFQINLPLEQLAQAARDLKERKFNPADIAPLAQRRDEIGDMARDFLKMAEAVQSRSAELEREAAEIRAKIK